MDMDKANQVCSGLATARHRCPTVKLLAFGQTRPKKEQGLILQHWDSQGLCAELLCVQWMTIVLWDFCGLASGFQRGLKAPDVIYKPSVTQDLSLLSWLQDCCLICRSPPAEFLNAGSWGALLQHLKGAGTILLDLSHLLFFLGIELLHNSASRLTRRHLWKEYANVLQRVFVCSLVMICKRFFFIILLKRRRLGRGIGLEQGSEAGNYHARPTSHWSIIYRSHEMILYAGERTTARFMVFSVHSHWLILQWCIHMAFFPDLIISWALSNSPIYVVVFFFPKHISCTFVHNTALLYVQLPILDLYPVFLSFAYVSLDLWWYQALKAGQDWLGRTGQHLKGKPLMKTEFCGKCWQYLGRDALLSDRWLGGSMSVGALSSLCKIIDWWSSRSPNHLTREETSTGCGVFSQAVGCQLAGRKSQASGLLQPKDTSSF